MSNSNLNVLEKINSNLAIVLFLLIEIVKGKKENVKLRDENTMLRKQLNDIHNYCRSQLKILQ